VGAVNAELVQTAGLGVAAALAVVWVTLKALSAVGLLDHNGWVLRDQQPVKPAPEPRRVSAGTYQQLSLHELVARAHADAAAGAVCPLDYLPVSPDPRHKES
jgi:hypothetical protein